MNKHLLFIPFLLMAFCLKAQNFNIRQVKCGMEMPWEITYGPDNFIWATEARGYKVSRINPTTGASTVVLNLTNNKNFANYPSVSPQGGLMGMVLHPNLLSGKPYVYLAYVYRYDGGSAPTGYFFKTKIARYTYNATAQTLTNEQVLCDTIPGSNDHNGGRMSIANINGTPYLFYGVGDMGAGQFDNASRKNKAQDPTSYEGKILRFNLEPDADTNVSESWIPNDGANTFGKAIYSIGHRNPQGMVVGKNGQLYEAEHGPYSDDELNLINANGLNFGFPVVVGLADGNYNNAAVGEGSGVPVIANEVNNAISLGANYRNPLKSFFPSDNATIRQIYQNSVNNTPPYPNYFLSWNSIAPSGIDYYNSTAIPNWQNSLLVTSLKRRRVYRLQLDATGNVVSDTLPLFPDLGRYRDLAISPDGTKIYVSCDSEGQTSGPTNGTTIDPINKGCILEFAYTPTNECAITNCPTTQTVMTATNSAVVTWSEPSLSNCWNGTTIVASQAPGTTFPLGTTTVIYTATDPTNFKTTCSFNVVVNTQNVGGYCISKSSAPWNEWVSNVTLNTLNNTSEKTRADRYQVGYSDWTDKSTTLSKGQTYPLSITPSLGWIGNLPNIYCRVWIDFNNNKVFEDSEIVLQKNNLNPMTASVLVPTTATVGTTRMRVSLKNSGYPTACEQFANGEVEDYTIQITEGSQNTIPDLVLENIMAASTFEIGVGHNLSYNIRNGGNASATSISSYVYLSADNQFSSDDVLVSSNFINSLAVGESQLVNHQIEISPTWTITNPYFFIKIVPLSTETNLANNNGSIAVNVTLPPLPTCNNAIGTGQLLCYSPNSDGSTTIILKDGNNIVQKVLDKNGLQLSSTNIGSANQDSLLVRNNQVIKKLANGTIAFTKTITPSVLSRVPKIDAALEMSDGSFVLAGFQKYYDAIYPPSNRDSFVLVTTDANLNYQNQTIEARNQGPYNLPYDTCYQLHLMPNNQFVVSYGYGVVGLVTISNHNLAKYQKNGNSLQRLKASGLGIGAPKSVYRTTACANNLIFSISGNRYGQKGSFYGELVTIYNLDSLIPLTLREVGQGSTDYYGSYKTYSYYYRPSLRDTSYRLSANYLGDPRLNMNNFSKLEIRFLNNVATVPTHIKTAPFVQYEHIVRTGDTSCLILSSRNGILSAFNPDCNNTPVQLPDLTLTNLTIPTPSVQQGNVLSWKVDIKNIGTAAITGNFSVKAYISKDNVLSADDVQNGVIPTGNFAAGFSVPQVAGASTIPTSVPAGQYYLILVADADNQVTESNETNNTIVSTSTFVVTATPTVDYCASKGTAPWEYWVSNTSFNTINNTSDKFKDYATLGYSDYTNLTTTVNKGQTYPLSITPGLSWIGNLPNTYCHAWIDFNNNKTFEANELVLEKTNANPFTTNVLIPTTAITGSVRMRVAVKFGSYPTACETFDRGEVEDYTLNIVGGTTSNLPDLTVSFSSAYQCGGTHACTDGFSGISVRIKNQGTAAAAATSLKFYQSADETFDASDTPLLIGPKSNPNTQCGGLPYGAEILIPNLAAGATLDTFIYAGQPSNVYWIAKTDANNLIVESNENNNTFAQCYKPSLNSITTAVGQDTFRTNLATANQLQIAYLIAINPYCLSGANFISLTNAQLTYYLSTDTVLSADDISVPFTITGTANFGTHNTDVTVPNTVASGVYYLIAKATVQDFCVGSPNTRTTFRRIVVVNGSVTNTNDIALSLTSTPSVYKPFSSQNFTISAKNNGNQAFTNVKIEFKFPTNTTNGGMAIPSVGVWNEWCAGGIQCFTWTIPTLAANAMATLNVPVYVLNPTSPMVATAKLLSSSPVDNVVANNTATISLNAAPPLAKSIQSQTTQLIPIVVDKISPNPSDGEVTLEVESLDTREVTFDFSDAFGKTVKSEIRKVEKGANRVLFEVWELPQGIYFVSPSTNKGKNMPTKFVKM